MIVFWTIRDAPRLEFDQRTMAFFQVLLDVRLEHKLVHGSLEKYQGLGLGDIRD